MENEQLVFWGAVTLMCIVPVIAHYWYRIKKTEWEMYLKHEMVARGMSANEIERVLRAKSRRRRR